MANNRQSGLASPGFMEALNNLLGVGNNNSSFTTQTPETDLITDADRQSFAKYYANKPVKVVNQPGVVPPSRTYNAFDKLNLDAASTPGVYNAFEQLGYSQPVAAPVAQAVPKQAVPKQVVPAPVVPKQQARPPLTQDVLQAMAAVKLPRRGLPTRQTGYTHADRLAMLDTGIIATPRAGRTPITYAPESDAVTQAKLATGMISYD